MASVVADTHAIIWYLTQDPRLSRLALESFDDATRSGDPIYVPAICVVEMVYLVEKRRLPPMAKDLLIQALDDPNRAARLVPMNRRVLDAVSHVNRSEVPDLPDRVIAATALALGLPLVSRDAKIRASLVQTIW